MIKSFLENRRAYFQFHPGLTHAMEIGCPQGSALSPFLWAILMDDALRLEYPFSNTTSRSDLLIPTRLPLWATCRSCFTVSSRGYPVGSSAQGPQSRSYSFFSKSPKTLKSAYQLELSLSGARVKGSAQTRWLGYILDQKLNWLPHRVSLSLGKTSDLCMQAFFWD